MWKKKKNNKEKNNHSISNFGSASYSLLTLLLSSAKISDFNSKLFFFFFNFKDFGKFIRLLIESIKWIVPFIFANNKKNNYYY